MAGRTASGLGDFQLIKGLTRRSSLGAFAAAMTAAATVDPARSAKGGNDAGFGTAVSRSEIAQWRTEREVLFLLEAGREGLFRWENGNFTNAVAVDVRQAIHIPSSADPSGAQGVWKRVMDGGVHLAWFGAKFDVGRVEAIAEASDDSDAWDAALAYLASIGGGTLHLPHGASKVTREIIIPYNGIRIVGTGTRKVYPGKIADGRSSPSTIIPVHGSRNAIRFIAMKDGDGAFCGENFNIATIESGSRPEAAFGWETQHAFLYGFTFRRLGIHGFVSAFDSYKNGGSENAVGAVLIDDCVINRNQWIVRSLLGTQFNGLKFLNNKAGQNGYQVNQGGISISGHDILIQGNIIEGCRDPVYIFGSYRDISVNGNYFESNVGRACVYLKDILGPYSVGPNNYGILDYGKIDHKVILEFCGLGQCVDPYWPHVVHKPSLLLTGGAPASRLKNEVNSSEYGFCRLDTANNGGWVTPPIQGAKSAVNATNVVEREIHPITGLAFPAQIYTTSGAGHFALRYFLTGSVGEWVAMSWLFKRRPDGRGSANPYVSMKVNGGPKAGSRDYVPYGFSQAWRDGEWCLITTAIRLEAQMSSLLLLLYPHGTNPGEGRVTTYAPPQVYTVGDIADVAPFIDRQSADRVAAPPTSGNWLAGDMLRNSAPQTGAVHFLCRQGGAPGNWIAI